jgi:hypothetical protein
MPEPGAQPLLVCFVHVVLCLGLLTLHVVSRCFFAHCQFALVKKERGRRLKPAAVAFAGQYLPAQMPEPGAQPLLQLLLLSLSRIVVCFVHVVLCLGLLTLHVVSRCFFAHCQFALT